MASTMTKRGQLDNSVTYEFVCDSLADLEKINPQERTMGSIAIVIDGSVGFEVYMANSQREWINISGDSESSEEEP